MDVPGIHLVTIQSSMKCFNCNKVNTIFALSVLGFIFLYYIHSNFVSQELHSSQYAPKWDVQPNTGELDEFLASFPDNVKKVAASAWMKSGVTDNIFNITSHIETFPQLKKDQQQFQVFYNRVPKCGSSAMLNLVKSLAKKNTFVKVTSPIYKQFNISKEDQDNFVQKFQYYKTPLFYDRHLHFFDFTRYGLDNPIYINVIREPLSHMISWYYFIRYQPNHIRNMTDQRRNMTFSECVTNNHPECMSEYTREYEGGYFSIIPFFCGQEEICRKSSKEALEKAKRNVMDFYLIVGYTEKIYETLEILEFFLPSYFKGATVIFEEREDQLEERFKTVKKIPPSELVIKIMKEKMKYEYEFYDFIKQRFEETYKAIKELKDNEKERSIEA